MQWQLRMFQKTLKKKLRLKALKRHLGPLAADDRCLLVTCGDNNGAMNYHLRAIGGRWHWADLEEKSIGEMAELLEESVLHVENGKLPFEDAIFDVAVAIDVHEHLADPGPFTREMRRVTRLGGKVIVTVPNGDESLVATRIKNMVGMTKEKYGHYREGFDVPELKRLMGENGIDPLAESTFSRFFTEMLELSINFLYVNILSRRSRVAVQEGTIAPATKNQLKSIEKTYRLYSLIYPLFRVISSLDGILAGTKGYVVMVEGRKV